ncbi:MAG TPA: hypothetical protein VFA49_13060, partial [Chloroflexota bacterium]|nr:hypothetical protein [Chloroflexota bacterium]
MTSRQYQEYGLTEWLRAHRVELGPAYAAISTLLLGGAVSGFLTAAQAAITVAALALGCAFWTVRAQGWRRPFYGIVSVTACAWVGSTYFYTSAQVWLWGVVILFAASVVLGIPWWSDHV